jgi:ABC-2 type transport system permease protein
MAMQTCISVETTGLYSAAKMFSPLMVFTFAGGIVLAFDGFSFLTKRVDSDFYHSLPVSRKGLFWSITLAALTWIAATVLASVILTTVVYTVSRTVFVPYYPLIAVPFYIVATMLVFAAAAIGCSLSGTIITDFAIVMLILFLPRFLQFVVARGIVAKVQIMSWIDLPWILKPTTNIATGQIVVMSRTILNNYLFNFANIAYSFVIAAVELVIGCLLFQRRPSEVAEHGAKNDRMQTLYACLLVLPIVLLFASGAILPNKTNILIVVSVALGCYAIYQVVVMRNARKVLRSLPWFIIPVLFSVCLYFGVQIAGRAERDYVPASADVASVQFAGVDRASDKISYGSYLVAQVEFSDEEMIGYVLETLQENVDSVRLYGYYRYDYDELEMNYITAEPVIITLKNGKKIGRTITFTNGNRLNEMREQNAEYAEAIRTLPPTDSIRLRQGWDIYDENYAQSEEIMQTYYRETEQYGNIQYSEYRQRSIETSYYNQDENQAFGGLVLEGYVGMTRYNDYYEINLETPETVSEWMKWQNDSSTNEYLDLLVEITDASAGFLDEEDYMNVTYTFYNIPMSDSSKQSYSFYYSPYASDTSNYSLRYQELAAELAGMIERSTPTTDPNALCVFVQWSARATAPDGSYIGAEAMRHRIAAASYGDGYVTAGETIYSSDGTALFAGEPGSIYSYNPSYRAFAEEDRERLLELLGQWRELDRSWYYEQEPSTEEEPTIAGSEEGLLPAISPTPTPAN